MYRKILSDSSRRQGTKGPQQFLRALRLHLELLAEDYPGTVQVTISEV